MSNQKHHPSCTNWYQVESTDEWATPLEYWWPLSLAIGGFDLDTAAGAERSPVASEAYSLEAGEDGLQREWYGRVWINPPYSDIEPWIERAWRLVEQGEVELVIMLLPVRSDTQWWQTYVARASMHCLIEGRISYHRGSKNGSEGEGHNTPFPSAYVVFGEYPEELVEVLNTKGLVYEQAERYRETEQRTLSELSERE